MRWAKKCNGTLGSQNKYLSKLYNNNGMENREITQFSKNIHKFSHRRPRARARQES